MSRLDRQIRLSKIHAICWYGYMDSIPVDGNTLLAGITGSGKSILMDLVQLVLVGDERQVCFNQSATGARSKRTLKGYCLGDTKFEEDGVTQYMRNAAVTYIALEFSWPKNDRHETWGFRVEFSSSADQNGVKTPFFIPSALALADFLDSKRQPLDGTEFKQLVESRKCRVHGTPGRLYSGIEEYLRDMAQPAHLNFDRLVLRTLLPMAMSFTFLQNFDEFCREFILPPDSINIADVTTSYRTFLRFESELRRLEDELQHLTTISELAERAEKMRRDSRLAEYLEAEARERHAVSELAEEESRLAALQSTRMTEIRRSQELEGLIPECRQQLEQLKALLNETDDGKAYTALVAKARSLDAEIGPLTTLHDKVGKSLSRRIQTIGDWLKGAQELPLDCPKNLSANLEAALRSVDHGKIEETIGALRDLDRALQQFQQSLIQKTDPKRRKLRELDQRKTGLKSEIAALKIGKLPFPTHLLDAINHALPSKNGEPRAVPLCKLCEVTDERWRVALEVAFVQKFAIVVSERDYPEAEAIYHALRDSAPRESLVDPTAAVALNTTIEPGSLAECLETADPIARSVISHLFGRMARVESRQGFGEHRQAVTPDGFVRQAPFVVRPHHYDEQPFLGARGLAQQLDWKQEELHEVEQEIAVLAPVCAAVNSLNQDAELLHQACSEHDVDIARTERLPGLLRDRNHTEQALQSIDRSKFDDLATREGELTKQLGHLEQELRRLDQSPNSERVKQLEVRVERYRSAAATAKDKFEPLHFDTWFSQWLNVIDELRVAVLNDFPMLDKAAARFGVLQLEYDKDAAVTWEKLVAARTALRSKHSRFQDEEFGVDLATNLTFERVRMLLSKSEIPSYREKAKNERQNWEGLFRQQVLDKLGAALQKVDLTRRLLNEQLKRPIGNDRYHITQVENPDFRIYQKLIDANMLAQQSGLFFESADAEVKETLQDFVRTLADESKRTAAARLIDYRRYHIYDMEVEDTSKPDLPRASLNRQSGKFSGGENQSPYFIAIMASYLRAYKRHDLRGGDPSLALVPIDEAFSKLSGGRIKDCVQALEHLGLQGLLSMSTGNVPYALRLCDTLIAVHKQTTQRGKSTSIRNIAVSVARDSDEARRLIGEQ